MKIGVIFSVLLIFGTFVVPLNTNDSYGDGILLFTVHRTAGSGEVNTENLTKERCFVHVQIDVYSSHHGPFHRNNPDKTFYPGDAFDYEISTWKDGCNPDYWQPCPMQSTPNNSAPNGPVCVKDVNFGASDDSGTAVITPAYAGGVISVSKQAMAGASWGEVTEYHDRGENPHMTVLDEIQWDDVNSYHFGILKQKTATEQKQLDVFSVGYDVEIIDAFDVKANSDEDEEENDNNVTNSFLVSSHLPFPVSGTYYNPSYVIEPFKEYEFELVNYLETKSNRPPQEPINNNDDIPTDVDPDLPITITGTIELTFPDDPIPSDDDVVTSDDDDVVTSDDVKTNNSESTQNDSTMSVIVILAIVLGVAGFVIWRRPSFQLNKKKKNQNITKKRITFEDKIKLEIETEI